MSNEQLRLILIYWNLSIPAFNARVDLEKQFMAFQFQALLVYLDRSFSADECR